MTQILLAIAGVTLPVMAIVLLAIYARQRLRGTCGTLGADGRCGACGRSPGEVEGMRSRGESCP
jgi:hypothetical protein